MGTSQDKFAGASHYKVIRYYDSAAKRKGQALGIEIPNPFYGGDAGNLVESISAVIFLNSYTNSYI